jgi:hypothetical protein
MWSYWRSRFALHVPCGITVSFPAPGESRPVLSPAWTFPIRYSSTLLGPGPNMGVVRTTCFG